MVAVSNILVIVFASFTVLLGSLSAFLWHRLRSERAKVLQEGSREKAFVSYVFHEMRNPLNGVVSYVAFIENMLRDYMGVDEDYTPAAKPVALMYSNKPSGGVTPGGPAAGSGQPQHSNRGSSGTPPAGGTSVRSRVAGGSISEHRRSFSPLPSPANHGRNASDSRSDELDPAAHSDTDPVCATVGGGSGSGGSRRELLHPAVARVQGGVVTISANSPVARPASPSISRRTSGSRRTSEGGASPLLRARKRRGASPGGSLLLEEHAAAGGSCNSSSVDLNEELDDDDTLDIVLQDVVNARASCSHVMDVLNHVLDLAKLDSGHVEVTWGEVDLLELVNEACAVVQSLDRNVPVLVQCYPSSMKRVFGDKRKLRQVLINLLSNSLKFTAHGFVKVFVTQEQCGRPGFQRVFFEVCDTGPGIDEKQQGLLFNKFKTTGSVFSTTGLGLFLSQRFVTLMGGEIRIASPWLGPEGTFRAAKPIPAVSPTSGGPTEDQKVSISSIIEETDAYADVVMGAQLRGSPGSNFYFALDMLEVGAEDVAALMPQLDVENPRLLQSPMAWLRGHLLRATWLPLSPGSRERLEQAAHADRLARLRQRHPQIALATRNASESVVNASQPRQSIRTVVTAAVRSRENSLSRTSTTAAQVDLRDPQHQQQQQQQNGGGGGSPGGDLAITIPVSPGGNSAGGKSDSSGGFGSPTVRPSNSPAMAGRGGSAAGGGRLSIPLTTHDAAHTRRRNDTQPNDRRASSKSAASTSRRPSIHQDLPRKWRVLIVDDLKPNRDILSRKFTRQAPFQTLSWSVVVAINGEQALELVKEQQERFDVVCLDQNMEATGGVLHGTDVSREIRRYEAQQRADGHQFPPAIVVATTGQIEDGEQLFFDAGMDLLWSKPWPKADKMYDELAVKYTERLQTLMPTSPAGASWALIEAATGGGR